MDLLSDSLFARIDKRILRLADDPPAFVRGISSPSGSSRSTLKQRDGQPLPPVPIR